MTGMREQTDVFISRELSPAAVHARFAKVAREGRDKLIAEGRAAPRFDTFVDGRQGGDEMTAQSTILYRFRYLGDAAYYAIEFLIARAPVRTGAFRASFFVGVDGRYVPAAQFRPNGVPETAEIVVGNLEPYDRKIDVQIAGGHRLHFSTPPDLYADAARAVRRAFRGAVAARRTYNVNFPGQWVLRRGARKGARVHSPGIILRAAA